MSYPEQLQELDRWFARGVERAGADVVLCRRGCSACCHGPFDISPADALVVAKGLQRLDATTQTAVRQRAAAQLDRYRHLVPQWSPPWDVEALPDDVFDRLSDALADARCPALGEAGECLIYDHRPATCRMTGLALQTPDDEILDNVCPIITTSARYAALAPTLFDLSAWEIAAEAQDDVARAERWVCTTVAGAIGRAM